MIRCNNFTTLNVDSNGVFTWTFDNRPNEKLNGMLQIYFGDNAIDFIVENETYYNLGRDYIETFFDDVDYKKENFFALKIKGFYYDSLESETGLLDSNITKYYYGFELDDNRLQAICPETIEMMVFEYVD
ncbi:MAG: hypothetical protein IJZ36_03465 [Bacilli bacterium]|nr:hypothetical protein [Bacilli bacterium]